MKKLISLLTLAFILTLGAATTSYAQPGEDPAAAMSEADSLKQDSILKAEEAARLAEEEAKAEADAAAAAKEAEEKKKEEEEDKDLHQTIKQKFIDGGPFFMSLVLISLILGLAFCIERILYLNFATTNTSKLISNVEDALETGGVEAAKEVCRNTSGPVASIFYQGLERAGEGPEMVEKAVVSYGSVQMGLLEKGVSWISLFIALAPMLGFFGTVIGMIGAFEAIAEANNISPDIVADGIGVALITTVSGLLVAMVLQIFYNYIVAKVDSLVNDMENASISLVDLVIRYREKNA